MLYAQVRRQPDELLLFYHAAGIPRRATRYISLSERSILFRWPTHLCAAAVASRKQTSSSFPFSVYVRRRRGYPQLQEKKNTSFRSSNSTSPSALCSGQQTTGQDGDNDGVLISSRRAFFLFYVSFMIVIIISPPPFFWPRPSPFLTPFLALTKMSS